MREKAEKRGKVRFDLIAIVVSGLSMIGTLGNFLYNLEKARTKVSLKCFPVLSEPARLDPFFGEGLAIWYYEWCEATNMGSTREYIASVHVDGEGSIGYQGTIVFGPTMGGGLATMRREIMQYNSGTGSLDKAALPLGVESGATTDFVTTSVILIGEGLIENQDDYCSNPFEQEHLIPKVFLRDCLNLSCYVGTASDRSHRYRLKSEFEVRTTRGAVLNDDYLLFCEDYS